MARPRKDASQPTQPSNTTQVIETKPTTIPVCAHGFESRTGVCEHAVEKYEYFRIDKISGNLARLLCVEVDEGTNPPRVVGKADLPLLIQDRAMPYLYPSVDMRERRAKEKAKAEGKK